LGNKPGIIWGTAVLKAALILAWAVISIAIVTRQPDSFKRRWVSLPPAMSWQTLNAARRAAERPTGMTYTFCKWPNCQRS
jgi:hypothetical protein